MSADPVTEGGRGVKLNLGCGEFPKPGYVNLDYYAQDGADVIHDLNVFPYPFGDGEAELVEADHVLEHLDDPFAVMRELHRITRDGGRVVVRVPHFSRGFTHPEHKRGFNISLWMFFDPSFQGGYQGVAYELERMRMRWFAQPYLKKIHLSRHQYYLGFLFGQVCDLFARLSPFMCSRIWCYWVGGFDEVEFILTVRKRPKTRN